MYLSQMKSKYPYCLVCRAICWRIKHSDMLETKNSIKISIGSVNNPGGRKDGVTGNLVPVGTRVTPQKKYGTVLFHS